MAGQSSPRPFALNLLVRELDLEEHIEIWQDDWDRSEEQLRLVPCRWMSEESIAEACVYLGLEADVQIACISACRWIGSSDALKRLAWHFYTVVFHGDRESRNRIRDWPMIHSSPEAPMFYATVYLSGTAEIRRRHEEAGIPEEVTRRTLRDIDVWMKDYRRTHGEWGCDEISWLSRHFSGSLYQLGRLQFEITRYRHDFHTFRHSGTGRVVTLADEGMRFRPDGQFDGTNGLFEGRRVWTSRYKRESGYIEGNPVVDSGRTERRAVRLKESDWKEVLRKNDPVLFVHIPASDAGSGRLTPGSCQRSFEEALLFFPRFFPGHPFHGFTTVSWLLDNQLSLYLPVHSNIRRFQSRFHLLPFPDAKGIQIIRRVFGGDVADWSRISEDTSLKRAVAEHIRKGKDWRMSAGFFLPDEV